MTLPTHTEVLETLGEGSFGVVVVARLVEGALSRTVVLKVLKKDWEDDDEILVRSRDEASLLARLNHDNIVKVEQLTAIQGRPALVMEYVQGLSLDRLLSTHGPFPVGVALDIVSKVAGALDAAYNGTPPGDSKPLHVIHRDIKPSNILMSISGAVKVLDFGTARGDFDSREAMTQALTLGSPLYMAPECFDATPPHPAVDVYALGATLYELVAGVPLGKLPMRKDKREEQLKERLERLRPAELENHGGALKALRDLVHRMVRYEAENRPTSRDVRRLCREYLKRLPPGMGLSLDQFAEVVVEPLYLQRKVIPPIPLDGTLDSSGVRKARGTPAPSDSGMKTSSPSPLHGTPAPVGGAPPTPPPVAVTRAPTPPPAAVPRAPTPPPAPIAPTPPIAQEPTEGAPVKRVVMLVAVGLLVGLAVALAVSFAMREDKAPPTAPDTVQPAPAEPAKTEPAKTEPTRVEPAKTEPAKTEPAKTEPAKTEPARAAPAKTEPAKTEPTRVEPAKTEPAKAEPAKVEPAKTEPAKVEPAPGGPTHSVRMVSLPAGATVSIGGQSAKTPDALNLANGSYSATVSFPDGPSGSCTVNIGDGTTRLAFKVEGDGSLGCP